MLTRDEFEILLGSSSDAIYALLVKQQEDIIKLTAAVKVLQDRLDKDSNNSSKPPSSDGFKKKPVTLRAKSGNKPGGHKGHPGSGLAFSDNPNYSFVHSPSSCGKCGANLTQVLSQCIEERQSFDIPPPSKIECTQHQLHWKCCPDCGEMCSPPFPEGVEHRVQYGPRFNALMLYLTSYMMIPSARVREMALDLFGVRISEGTLYSITNRAHNTLAPVETAIKDALPKQKVIHCDETGARVNGSLHWIHVVCTSMLTVYSLSKRRGKVAMDEMGILSDLLGRAMHDGWKAYFRFACDHALCNAHHLRELKALFEQHGQQWAADMIAVLIDIKTAVEKSKAQGQQSIPSELLRELEDRYESAVTAGKKANPPPEATGQRGRPRHTIGGNLVRRLDDYRKETLAFLYDFDVPFDNNQAERDVRMMKVKLKVSGSFRSEKGAKAFCRIRGYLSTMRKQQHNVLAVLRSVCQGSPTTPIFEFSKKTVRSLQLDCLTKVPV